LCRTDRFCGVEQETEIEFQERHCVVYAEQNGLDIVDTSREYDISGVTPLSEREALLDIVIRAENGEFDVLLVYEFSVLGESDTAVAEFVETLQRHGVSVWSVNDDELKDDNVFCISREAEYVRELEIEDEFFDEEDDDEPKESEDEDGEDEEYEDGDCYVWGDNIVLFPSF
jgi:hypothetical protein